MTHQQNIPKRTYKQIKPYKYKGSCYEKICHKLVYYMPDGDDKKDMKYILSNNFNNTKAYIKSKKSIEVSLVLLICSFKKYIVDFDVCVKCTKELENNIRFVINEHRSNNTLKNIKCRNIKMYYDLLNPINKLDFYDKMGMPYLFIKTYISKMLNIFDKNCFVYKHLYNELNKYTINNNILVCDS